MCDGYKDESPSAHPFAGGQVRQRGCYAKIGNATNPKWLSDQGISLVCVRRTTGLTLALECEYQRGYNDCSHGRYDQNQHGESYKKGCRAAEDHQKSNSPPLRRGPSRSHPGNSSPEHCLAGGRSA